ncbi:MAG: divalent-cation tolerance protein CutA [bacterium]|nr:divalent-cation tolerance protein CutA [bacterium]
MKYIVVFITASEEEQAKKIAEELVSKRLIACANILPKVSSLFWWQGRICSEKEVLLILKTKEDLLDKVIKTTKELHSYEVPEIIALPIIGGSEEYLEWINKSVKDEVL